MLYQHDLKTTKEQYKNNIILEKIRSSETTCQKLYNKIFYIFLLIVLYISYKTIGMLTKEEKK